MDEDSDQDKKTNHRGQQQGFYSFCGIKFDSATVENPTRAEGCERNLRDHRKRGKKKVRRKTTSPTNRIAGNECQFRTARSRRAKRGGE